MARKTGTAEIRHPDGDARFEVDFLLRSRGFRIWRRRGKLPAVWVRRGVEYSQEQAEAQLNGFDLERARRLENSYYFRRWMAALAVDKVRQTA